MHIKIYVRGHKITGRMFPSAFEMILKSLSSQKSWNYPKLCWSCFKTLKLIKVWGLCIENKEKPQKRDRLLSTDGFYQICSTFYRDTSEANSVPAVLPFPFRIRKLSLTLNTRALSPFIQYCLFFMNIKWHTAIYIRRMESEI